MLIWMDSPDGYALALALFTLPALPILTAGSPDG